MIHSRKRSNDDPLDQRRAEIEHVLEAHGFAKRKLGRVQQASDDDSDEYMRRVSDLLQLLGPVFAHFGLYLSSRPDLLSLTDCIVLTEIPNRSRPTPHDAVRQIIRDELNSEIDDPAVRSGFVKFDPTPFESRLLFQLHYGQLENGDLVVVKVVHPRIDTPLEFKLLPSIAHIIAPRMVDPEKFHTIVENFQAAIASNLNGQRTAELLETLTHDCRDRESICLPKVHHELCTKNILVTERLDGLRLDLYIAQCRGETHSSDGVANVSGIVNDELARLLCDAWLRQAFEGTLIPIEIRPENILIRSPTEIAILDGSFATFPAASRRNLLDYFIAAATNEPSKALKSLLKELDATQSTGSESNLDREFRQVVAFRDGGWEDGGLANCLSDTLFAQWRLLARSRYQPLRHLTHLYRGTFHITSIARQVAPQRDSLAEGIKDLRLTKLLNDIGTMMEPSYWGGQMDRLASLMILGPQHLDEALKTMAEEKKSSKETTGNGNHQFKSAILLLAALLAIVLFRDQLTASLTPAMAEMITAATFIAIGGLMLRVLSRGEYRR